MRRVLLPLSVAAACLALAGPAAAQLPLGEDDGVRIVRERGALVVVFGQRADGLRRRVAERRVSLYCDTFIPPNEDGLAGTESGGMTYRMPRRGRRLRTGDGTRDLDVCRLWLEPRPARREVARAVLIAAVPMSKRGAVYLDELERTRAMLAVQIGAQLLPGPSLPTTEELTARVPRLPSSGLRVVGLASPEDTPPAGAVGYHSSGGQGFALVVLSRSGRRLFISYEGDVLRTNVANYIYEEDYDHYLGTP